MAIRSTIMDTNSFRTEDAAGLDPATRLLTERRDTVLGASYRLFYRNPVHLVRGEGQYLWDAAGRKYLDAYNNVASLGHCHPAVTAAVTAQMQQLNTHTRYLHERILDYTDDLLSTMPAELRQGDVHVHRLRGQRPRYPRGEGVQRRRGHHRHHGGLPRHHRTHLGYLARAGNRPAARSPRPGWLPPGCVPAGCESPVRRSELGTWFANRIRAAIADMEAHGIRFAGFLADSIFLVRRRPAGPGGYLREAADVVHRAGGIFIADEVQPGFGRTGETFWGFRATESCPTWSRSASRWATGFRSRGSRPGDVLAAFSDTIPYFNTFGGNPVSMAAAQAVLSTIRAEGLQEHSRAVGGHCFVRCAGLGDTHESVGDVRGAGLFIGFELVKDRTTRNRPASSRWPYWNSSGTAGC